MSGSVWEELGRRFEEGGLVMYLLLPLLLMGGVGAVANVLVLLFGARWKTTVLAGAATLGVAGLTTLTTGAGYALALQALEQAVVGVNPVDRAVILQAGKEEASNILYLGVLAVALPLLVGGITTAVGLSRRAKA
ncbi:MAG: hypothetical protein RL653_2723 [Pseudomonadota bacterium]